MTDPVKSPDTGAGTAAAAASPAGFGASDAEAERIRKRYRSEARFKCYGAAAIAAAAAVLFLLVGSIVAKGWSAFNQYHLTVEVFFDPAEINPAELHKANYTKLARDGLKARFPEAGGNRRERRKLYGLLSSGVDLQLLEMVRSDPGLIGQRLKVDLIASDDVDSYLKGFIDRDLPESDRRVKDNEIAWLDALEADDAVSSHFNMLFWTSGDSREPELAGFWGAMVG